MRPEQEPSLDFGPNRESDLLDYLEQHADDGSLSSAADMLSDTGTSSTRTDLVEIARRLGLPERLLVGEPFIKITSRILAAAQQRLTGCYNQVLRLKPGLSGKIRLRFSVELDGSVTNVTAAPVTDARQLTNTRVIGCMSDIIVGTQFARPGTQAALIEYPMMLTFSETVQGVQLVSEQDEEPDVRSMLFQKPVRRALQPVSDTERKNGGAKKAPPSKDQISSDEN